LFELPTKILGACFVQIQEKDHDNVDSQSVWCVFLGYSHTQKDIDVGIPKAEKYVVCANVTSLKTHLIVQTLWGPLTFFCHSYYSTSCSTCTFTTSNLSTAQDYY